MNEKESLEHVAKNSAELSKMYYAQAQDSMQEGWVQFEEVCTDLARNHQTLSDLLYAKAATL